MVPWPSIIWARYQADLATNQNADHASTPTQPSHTQSADGAVSAYAQPNPCLQLTQVLQWEIWNHDQTRIGLHVEQTHCAQLESHIRKLERDVAQWRESCETVYTALNEHRAEHATLQRDMNGVLAEVAQLRHEQYKSKVSV